MITPTRRALLAGTGSLGLSLGLAAAARAQSKAPLKVGFLTVKTGPLAAGGIQEEEGLHLLPAKPTHDPRRPPRAALHRRHRRRPRQHPRQGPGARRAGWRPRHHRPARRLRGPGHRRLHPPEANPGAVRSRRRGHHPAQGRPLGRPRHLLLRPMHPAARRLRPQGPQVQQDGADRRRLRLRPTNRTPASSASSSRRAERSSRSFGPPLNAPDYGTYIAQLKPDIDAIFMSFAGSNGLKFFQAYKEYGGNKPILGGMTAVDEATLQQMGDDAIGVISACFYSAQLDNPANKKFVAEMLKDYHTEPGYYALRLLRRRPRARSRPRKDPRRHRGQEGLHGRAAQPRHQGQHPRPDVVRQIRQRRRQRLHPQSPPRRTAASSTPSSRPTPTSASSGPTTRPAFLKEPVYSRDWPPAKNL